MRIASLTLIVFLSAVCFFGQSPDNPDNWCRQGLFTRETTNFYSGYIKGKKGTKVYFHDDISDDCPMSSACRSTAYVLPGYRVLTTRKYNGFVCTWFAPLKGEPTVGWLRESEVDLPLSVAYGGTKDFVGDWRYAENSISIAFDKDPKFVRVKGNAFWKGMGDNIHIGELDGRFAPNNGVINYSDGADEFDCQATIRLLTDYLVVSDNMNCGGANVTFSGVYRKFSKIRTKKKR